MIDGNAKDFIDKLSYEDHYVIYDGKKFFFNGCQVTKDEKGKIIKVVLEIYNLTCNSTIFSTSRLSISDCITDFENAKIWNGKTFWEVEKDMQWVDC